jgi:hypothetical protein
MQEVKRAGVGKVIAVAGQGDGVVPENRRVTDVPKSEEVRREEQASRVAGRSAAACRYGWMSARMFPVDMMQPSEHPADAGDMVSTSVEIKSSSDFSEELGTVKESLSVDDMPARGICLTSNLEANAAFPLQEHDDAGGGGDHQQERPDVDKAEQQLGDTLKSG